MRTDTTSIGRRVAWSLMTVVSTATGLYALFLVATGFAALEGTSVGDNTVLAPYGLWTHIAGAGVTLVAGPWQFSRRLRARRPAVHRVMGRIYVVGALVGGGAGTVVALGTTGGPVAGVGFLLLGLVCGTTAMAYQRVRAGDFAGHRSWMVRSFAAALSAVTLRAYLGIALGAGLEFSVVYPWIAWVCWVPNLLVAEAWLRQGHRRVGAI